MVIQQFMSMHNLINGNSAVFVSLTQKLKLKCEKRLRMAMNGHESGFMTKCLLHDYSIIKSNV